VKRITLESKIDGFAFEAGHAPAQGTRRGGVVVAPEIFGLDRFVEADVARWSAQGFEVLAPSLFDRVEPGFTADHDEDGVRAGRRYAEAVGLDAAGYDIETCIDQLTTRGPAFVVGYCYGGSLAWLAACKVDTLAAASCYYGGLIAKHATARLLCPTVVHYGGADPHIPAEHDAALVRRAHPDTPVHVYEGAGHGFNNEGSPAFHQEAAELARARTLELFAANGAG
jgi:carboxymethylenebutenolidase